MKKIFMKYNYSFGYKQGYIALNFFPGVLAILLGIPLAVVYNSATYAIALILAGIYCLISSIVVIRKTRKKCPQGNNGLIKLALNMWLVGLVAALTIGFRFIKVALKFLGIAFVTSNSSYVSYANEYTSSDGTRSYLWSRNGNYAVFKDENGNTFEVRQNGNDGNVRDNDGNIYYPN